MISIDKDKLFIIFTAIVFVALAALRIVNLGYSDYIPDETTVMDHFRKNGPVLDLEYLAKQRKGPMQWLMVLPINFIYGNVFNELVFRVPFAIASILSIYFFYKFLETSTEDKYTALLGSFLFGVNGFMIAFGRIVQYQSLNLLFSSISLFFFAKFLKESDKKFCFYGIIFFTLSLFSHWDAVFILPYIIWVFIQKRDFKLILLSGLISLLLFSPFFVPFALFNFVSGENHEDYFSTRIGAKDTFSLNEVRVKNSLYNPFLFTTLCLVFLLVSVVWIKEYYIFWIWLVTAAVVFVFFIKTPGTHTYNLVIPMIILCSIGFVRLGELLPKEYRVVPLGLGIMACSFLYYQSFLIFVDTKNEYPWNREEIFRYKTKVYDSKTLTNNIIGFPYGRNWSEVRDFIQSEDGFEDYTFTTNDNSAVSSFYLDIPFDITQNMYLIGVKNPYTFVSDYQFSQIENKSSIKSVKDSNGETVVKIYKTK